MKTDFNRKKGKKNCLKVVAMQWIREEMWAWKSYNASESASKEIETLERNGGERWRKWACRVILSCQPHNRKDKWQTLKISVKPIIWTFLFIRKILISTQVKIQWIPEGHSLEIIVVHVHFHLGVNHQEPAVLAGDGFPSDPRLFWLGGGVPIFYKIAPPWYFWWKSVL